MILRVLERCQACAGLTGTYVATDDERIADAVRKAGGQAILTSPDHPSGTDRIAEAVKSLAVDIVVNVQGDQPFFDPTMISEVIEPLKADPQLPMSTLMHRISTEADFSNPSVVKVVVNRFGNALYFSRSLIPYPQRAVSHLVFEHVGLYAYRHSFLSTLTALPPSPLEQVESLEQLRVLENGYVLRVVETRAADHGFSGFSVDTEADLQRAEALLRERGLA